MFNLYGSSIRLLSPTLLKFYQHFTSSTSPKKLKETACKDSCFIIGNGASLRHRDLSSILKEPVLVTNWFILHPLFRKFENLTYCLTDPLFWRSREFSRTIVPALNDHPSLHCVFESQFFLPLLMSRDRPLLTRSTFVKRKNENFTIQDQGISIDLEQGVNTGSSSIFTLCFQIAFCMGFKNIYLLGCDFDYRLDYASDRSQAYFYEYRDLPQAFRKVSKRLGFEWTQATQEGRTTGEEKMKQDLLRIIKQFNSYGRTITPLSSHDIVP